MGEPHTRVLGTQDLLSCCASTAWASAVQERQPYRNLAELIDAGVAAVARMRWSDVLEALSAHPRIGERATGEGRHVAWSRAEQSGTAAAPPDLRDALRAGNAAYEARFGHIYLVCATGRTAEELLAVLRERLTHDARTERRTVRAELAAIVSLRLARVWEGQVSLW